MARAFDGEREFPLVTGACADFPTRANLAAVGQVTAQLLTVFVINEFVFVFAVNTDPAHRRTETALLSVPSPIASTAAIITRTAWTTRAAALLIFHTFGKWLLKLYSIGNESWKA